MGNFAKNLDAGILPTGLPVGACSMWYSTFRVALVLSLCLSVALGYGNAGHEAVGSLAAKYLVGTRAEQEIRKLLHEKEDLARASTWADRAKIPDKYLTAEMKEFVANNPDHHQFHYCDLPFQEKAYRLGLTGTNSKDIVQTIGVCIQVLRSPELAPENPLKINKRIALMLLAHYLGDLHQPLHVGCSYVDAHDHLVNPETGAKGQPDAGANNFRLTTRTTLHGYWDTATVKAARDHAKSLDFTGYLARQYPPQAEWKGQGPIEDWPREWATDTLQFSKKCFEGMRFTGRHTVPADEKHPAHDEWVVTLNSGYDTKSRDIVEGELAKAGYRLAEVLRAIWPGDALPGVPSSSQPDVEKVPAEGNPPADFAE